MLNTWIQYGAVGWDWAVTVEGTDTPCNGLPGYTVHLYCHEPLTGPATVPRGAGIIGLLLVSVLAMSWVRRRSSMGRGLLRNLIRFLIESHCPNFGFSFLILNKICFIQLEHFNSKYAFLRRRCIICGHASWKFAISDAIAASCYCCTCYLLIHAARLSATMYACHL